MRLLTSIRLGYEKALNESPSEKEGKSLAFMAWIARSRPSMKVPPKRKGNSAIWARA